MTRISIATFFIFLYICIPITAQPASNPYEWNIVFEHKGVKVETRLRKNGHLEYRGETRLKMRLALARNALLEALRSCTPEMKGCLIQTLTLQPNGTMLLYQKFDLPWPLTDRDLVLRGTTSEAGKSFWRLLLTSAPNLKETDDSAVRIVQAHGFWQLENTGGQYTVVRHQMYLEPGGNLSAELVNDRIRDIGIRTMNGIARHAHKFIR